MGRRQKLIVDQTFGSLTVISRLRRHSKSSGKPYPAIVCRCVCGTVKEYTWSNVCSGATTSCGCKRKKSRVVIVVDRPESTVVGKQFGFLTVLARSERGYILKCQCVCGVIKEIFTSNVTKGVTKSCGCKSRELSKATREWNKEDVGFRRNHESAKGASPRGLSSTG